MLTRILRTLRWKEYQHDIAIDLAAPFHRGSLAGAMMYKVDVHIPDPSWAHCPECRNPSNECCRGEKWWYFLSWWPSTAARCSPACVQFCYNERPGLFTCCK